MPPSCWSPSSRSPSHRFFFLPFPVRREELGLQVASQLQNHNERVVIMDKDPDFIRRAQQLGFEAITADIINQDQQAERYLSNAQTLVCTSADVNYNFKVRE